MSREPEIHATHDPEPADAPAIYKGATACRRCGWFVAFNEGTAFPVRITKRGQDICPGPMRVELRDRARPAAETNGGPVMPTIGEIVADLPVGVWHNLPEHGCRLRHHENPVRVDVIPVPVIHATRNGEVP